MDRNNRRMGRRKFLGSIASSGALTGIAGMSSASRTGNKENGIKRRETSKDTSVTYEKLRGNAEDPIKGNDIKKVREKFGNGRVTAASSDSEYALLNVEGAFDGDQIIGYNLLQKQSGVPKEQIVVRNPVHKKKASERRVHQQSSGNTRNDTSRLHRKADHLLQQEVSSSKETSEIDVAAQSWDEDWSSWNRFGSTEVYKEFSADRYSDRTGAVKFTNKVRSSPSDPRLAARTKVRLEPGRQLCNDGFDEYCTSSIQKGYRNKSATVHHHWDQPVNDTSTRELIVGTDPAGQVSSVTGTRTASIGLDLSREPSVSLGYSSSVSFQGAELRDKTSLMSGRSEHEFKVNSPADPSAGNTAIFEVGSATKYNRECNTNLIVQRSVLDITVELEWGLKFMGWTPHTENATQSFEYVTWCP